MIVRSRRHLLVSNATTVSKSTVAPNPLKADPTKTATLRRRFISELGKRFEALKKKILEHVKDKDVFGLAAPIVLSPFERHYSHNVMGVVNTDWKYKTDPDKLAAFKVWLATQIASTIGKSDDELWKQFAREGFEKGAARSFSDVNKQGQDQSLDFYQGTKDQFLKSAFGQPVATEKVKLLASRTFGEMEDVTQAMASSISRVLVDGLVQGQSPRDIAREMTKKVDGIGKKRAEKIARTEIVRAHAEGQLHALEQLGVTDLGVEVEWSTAGDGKVCTKCKAMEGQHFTTKQAKGKLPLHPHCRCAWIPYVPEFPDTPDEVDEPTQEEIEQVEELDTTEVGVVPPVEVLSEQEQRKEGSVPVVSPEQLQEEIANGAKPVFRGVTSKEFADKMKEGEPFAGEGDYGTGIYTTTDRNMAQSYAEGPEGDADGDVLHMAIDPNAKIVTIEDISKQHAKDAEAGLVPWEMDIGVYAKSKGYDAIEVRHKGYINVVNPDVLMVQDDSPITLPSPQDVPPFSAIIDQSPPNKFDPIVTEQNFGQAAAQAVMGPPPPDAEELRERMAHWGMSKNGTDQLMTHAAKYAQDNPSRIAGMEEKVGLPPGTLTDAASDDPEKVARAVIAMDDLGKKVCEEGQQYPDKEDPKKQWCYLKTQGNVNNGNGIAVCIYDGKVQSVMPNDNKSIEKNTGIPRAEIDKAFETK